MRKVLLEVMEDSSARTSMVEGFEGVVVVVPVRGGGWERERKVSRWVCRLKVEGVERVRMGRNCSSGEMASRVEERMPNLSAVRYLDYGRVVSDCARGKGVGIVEDFVGWAKRAIVVRRAEAAQTCHDAPLD